MIVRKKPRSREGANRGSGLRGKQMGVAIPDDLRERLNAESTAKGISIAEEIRRRLEKSYAEEDFNTSRPHLRKVAAMVMFLAFLSEEFTGKRWDQNPGTAKLLGLVFATHLELHYDADDLTEITLSDVYQRDRSGKTRSPEATAAAIEMMADLTLRQDPDVYKHIVEFETIKSSKRRK